MNVRIKFRVLGDGNEFVTYSASNAVEVARKLKAQGFEPQIETHEEEVSAGT